MRALLLILLFLNLAYFAYTRLVGEGGEPAAAPDAAVPVPRLTLVGEGGAVAPRCTSMGPFSSETAVRRGAAWLESGHHPARIRMAEAAGPTGYWVQLKTKTLQDAARISLRLRAGGVNDIAVLPPEAGGTTATLSLGIYSDREHAERRITDLRRFGVAPAVVEQPHTVTSWWLDFQLPAGDRGPAPEALAKAAEEAGPVSATGCPAAAAPPAPAAGSDGGAAPRANASRAPAAAAKLSATPA